MDRLCCFLVVVFVLLQFLNALPFFIFIYAFFFFIITDCFWVVGINNLYMFGQVDFNCCFVFVFYLSYSYFTLIVVNHLGLYFLYKSCFTNKIRFALI